MSTCQPRYAILPGIMLLYYQASVQLQPRGAAPRRVSVQPSRTWPPRYRCSRVGRSVCAWPGFRSSRKRVRCTPSDTYLSRVSKRSASRVPILLTPLEGVTPFDTWKEEGRRGVTRRSDVRHDESAPASLVLSADARQTSSVRSSHNADPGKNNRETGGKAREPWDRKKKGNGGERKQGRVVFLAPTQLLKQSSNI